MRPRNETQREVQALSDSLPGLTPAAERWVLDATADMTAYSTGKTLWCSECGSVHTVGEVSERGGKVTCPTCGKRLDVLPSRCRTSERGGGAVVTQVFRGWTVVRLFLVTVTMAKGHEAARAVHEVAQCWFRIGRRTVCYERRRASFCYSVRYILDRPMILKSDISSDLSGVPVYPHGGIGKEFRRRGVTSDAHGIGIDEVLTHVPSDVRYETLWKTGQYDLVRSVLRRSARVADYWPSAKIVIRHGYRIADAPSWMDHVTSLRELGMDLRNPVYVCPEDFAACHERITRLLARRRERMREEDERRDFVALSERLRRFDGMDLSSGGISIVLLRTRDDYRHEGHVQHNCVYANRYYANDTSLVVSARMGDRILETAEIDLRRYELLQCHGDHNRPSSHHRQIVDLLNGSMDTIRRYNTRRTEAVVV